MDNININLSVSDLKNIVISSLQDSINKSVNNNKIQIEKLLDNYFSKKFFSLEKATEFESNLDWAVDRAFREGLEIALGELNFKELIAEKAKQILSDDNFIKELAEKKVRISLGLPLN